MAACNSASRDTATETSFTLLQFGEAGRDYEHHFLSGSTAEPADNDDVLPPRRAPCQTAVTQTDPRIVTKISPGASAFIADQIWMNQTVIKPITTSSVVFPCSIA